MDKKNEIVVENGISVVIIEKSIDASSRNINWNKIEHDLKKYIGQKYKIDETDEIILIASDFPDEFSHSKDTHRLKGKLKKAKAKTSKAIDLLIQSAHNKTHLPYYHNKHGKKAKYGWYRYSINFKTPAYDDFGNTLRYNNYSGYLLVRIASNKKLYLYDIVKIKRNE